MDQLGIVDVARADRTKNLMGHDFGKSEDGVERRPELVAHIGEKARFRAARVLGKIACLNQITLVRLAFRDVAGHGDDIAHRIARPAGGPAAELSPSVSARFGREPEFCGRSLASARRGEGIRHDGGIFGVDEIRQRPPGKLFRRIAKQHVGGRARVVDAAVRGVSRDEIVGVLGKKTITRLARFGRFVGSPMPLLRGNRHQRCLDDRHQKGNT
jgi:hypothetical protein